MKCSTPQDTNTGPLGGDLGPVGSLDTSRASCPSRAGNRPCGDPSRAASGSGRRGAPSGPDFDVRDEVLLSIHEEKDGHAWEESTYGVITSTGEVLRADPLTRRVNRFGRARTNALEMAGWMRSQLAAGQCDPDGKGERLARLETCGDLLEFRQYLGDELARLHAGRFCQQPTICAVCAILRSSRLLRWYLPKIQTLVSGGLRPYFATFTSRNGEDLRERFHHQDKGLRTLMRDGWYARNRNRLRGHAWAPIVAAVFSHEFKRGAGTRGGLWHPHIHGLIFTREDLHPLDADRIRETWAEQLGDAVPDAQDIRPLRSIGETPAELLDAAAYDAIGDDLLEVFKYPLKFASMTPADRWHAAQCVRRHHLIRPFGLLRGLQPDPSFLAGDPSADDLPYLRLLYRFDRGISRYLETERFFVDESSTRR